MAFGEKFLTLLNGYDKYINMNASLENTENKNAPSEPIQTQFDNGWIHTYFWKNEEQFSDSFKRSKLLITSINQYDDNCVEQFFFVK